MKSIRIIDEVTCFYAGGIEKLFCLQSGMNLILLFTILSSLFEFAFSSCVGNVFTVKDKTPLSRESFDVLVESILRANESLTEESCHKSIFDDAIITFAAINKISEDRQYSIFIDSLLEYLKTLCLNNLRKFVAGQLTESDRRKIVSSIYLIALETKFFCSYKSENLIIPDKSVIIFFKTLIKIGQNQSKRIFFCFAKLAAFCESETCQDLLYPFLSEYLDKFQISTDIIFCKHPASLSRYEDFITGLFQKLFRRNLALPQIALMMKSLIQGPVIIAAANLINTKLDLDIIIEIISDDYYKHKLANLLIETDSLDRFLAKIASEGTCIEHWDIGSEFSCWKFLHTEITAMIKYNIGTVEFMKLAKEIISNNADPLLVYAKINLDTVRSCIKAIHNQVMFIIESLETRFNPKAVHAAFDILSLIPVGDIPLLKDADYSRLYDILMASPYTSQFIKTIPIEILRIPIVLSYTLITPEVLSKVYRIINLSHDRAEEHFLSSVKVAINTRCLDEEVYMRTVDVCFQFCEVNQLEFSIIAPAIMERLLASSSLYLANSLKTYFNDRNLLSRSVFLLVTSYLNSACIAAAFDTMECM